MLHQHTVKDQPAPVVSETGQPGHTSSLPSFTPNGQLDAVQQPWQRWCCSPLLHVALLAALSLFCFGKTVTSYFLADDFGELNYVYLIFKGNWNLLWSTLAGNYMQIPGMSVYRPWLLVTLISDWMLYHTNAWGYYLTNILHFLGCVVVLYLISRHLTRQWGPWRQSAASVLGAALFCGNPLKCESVSWVVGRVDIVCGFYYLLALLFFLRKYSANSNHKTTSWLSAITFTIALSTKEMAVGLPLVATAAVLLLPPCPSSEQNNGSEQSATGNGRRSAPSRLLALTIQATQCTAPLWICLIVFAIIRTTVLGTLCGGYTAGFGASQLAHMSERWCDLDTIRRLLIPLNSAIFARDHDVNNLFVGIYAFMATLATVRLLLGRLPGRILVFLLVWATTAALPIFQLWGVGANLEGSRFYFFLSMSLSLVLPVLLLSPLALRPSSTLKLVDLKLAGLSAAALAFLVYHNSSITVRTNNSWVQAGREVRRLRDTCVYLAKHLPNDKKAAILGVPLEKAGAHQILNGTTFNTMLSAPFQEIPIAQKFITYLPTMFGSGDTINGSRLCSEIEDKSVSVAYVWNRSKHKLEEMPWLTQHRSSGKNASRSLPYASHPGTKTETGINAGQCYTIGHATAQALDAASWLMNNVRADDGLRLSQLHINPLEISYLEFDLYSPSPIALTPLVCWSGPEKQGIDEETESQKQAKATLQPLKVNHAATNSGIGADTSLAACTASAISTGAILPFGRHHYHVYVNLGHYWRWYTQPEVSEVVILPGSSSQVCISNIEFKSRLSAIPELKQVGEIANNVGIIKCQGDVSLQAMLPAQKACHSVLFEVTKPNYFYDNFDTMDSAPVGTAIKQVVSGTFATRAAYLTIKGRTAAAVFPGSGYYQIRGAALDSAGRQISDYSEPLTIQVCRTHP